MGEGDEAIDEELSTMTERNRRQMHTAEAAATGSTITVLSNTISWN